MTGSDQSFKTALDWLKDCQSLSKSCIDHEPTPSQVPVVPLRLIEISQSMIARKDVYYCKITSWNVQLLGKDTFGAITDASLHINAKLLPSTLGVQNKLQFESMEMPVKDLHDALNKAALRLRAKMDVTLHNTPGDRRRYRSTTTNVTCMLLSLYDKDDETSFAYILLLELVRRPNTYRRVGTAYAAKHDAEDGGWYLNEMRRKRAYKVRRTGARGDVEALRLGFEHVPTERIILV